MAWIESHQTLVHHPKLLQLSHATGWTINESIGTIHRLWWWALAYAESGYLGNYAPDVISRAIQAQENDYYSHELLFDVLISCRFMTKNLFIHDWLDYAGRYLKTKYRNSSPDKLDDIKGNFDKPVGLPKGRPKGAQRADTFTYLPTYLNQPTVTNLECALEEILKGLKADVSSLILSDAFLGTFVIWTLYRKNELKKKLTASGLRGQLKKLADYAPAIAIKMIEQSIDNDWQGIFPLKENKLPGGLTAEDEAKIQAIKRDIRIASESLERAETSLRYDPTPENERRVKIKRAELAKLEQLLTGGQGA